MEVFRLAGPGVILSTISSCLPASSTTTLEGFGVTSQ
jgi:hypothetical protein